MKLTDEQIEALRDHAQVDKRPHDCRFRQQEEGRSYPRSSCQACGRGVGSGLGTKCQQAATENNDTIRDLASEVLESRAEIERLNKERDEARELKLDAESTLRAWFDLSKKAENAGAEILRDSVRMWLNKARSGGMPSKEADLVADVIDDATSLYLWKALVPVLRTMIDAKEARVAELEAAERGRAIAFIRDLMNMQSSNGWTRAVVREAAFDFLRGDPSRFDTKDTTPAFVQSAEARSAKAAAEARVAELEKALAQARAWHESEAKALSKSGRRDADYFWRLGGHTDQIADIREVLPDAEYHEALERIKCPHAPTYDAGLCCGRPDDCDFVSEKGGGNAI